MDAARRLSGGDVARTYWCRLTDAREVVAKLHGELGETRSEPHGEPHDASGGGAFFHEAASLRWLGAHGLRVADVLEVTPRALVLKYVPTVPATPDAVQAFGRALAEAHLRAEVTPGWPVDHSLAGIPQAGPGPQAWPAYFAERRILPMLERLERRGQLDATSLQALIEAARRIPDLIADDEPMVPLHGDLWWGNVLWSPQGAVLIDPAAYGGHREVDLAMLSLFGGPWEAFARGYGDVWPLRAGWARRRRAYQLYPLLVHVALFGGGYVAQAVEAARATG